MFRMKKEPEQGTNNTISLKCFLCQGNWAGTNKEELRKHLEKDHKVVFQIKELIELSKPEELEPTAATSDEEERLLAVTTVDTNSSEKMGQYFMTVISETRVNTNSGETKIIQYFNVDDYNYFSGQSGSENMVEIDTDIGFSSASH